MTPPSPGRAVHRRSRREPIAPIAHPFHVCAAARARAAPVRLRRAVRGLAALALLWTMVLPAHAVEIDGVLSPGEWDDGHRVDDFRMSQPLTRAPSAHATVAWVKALPDGLAVAFRSEQPAAVVRTRERFERDRNGNVDRVNVYVDFDGDGRSGYNFMLALSGGIGDSTISNENQFNADWDGRWLHAVSEDESGWSAEMLIPWHIAPMREGIDGRRTIGIALDRVVGDSNERMTWPAISFNDQRYLSALERIEIAAYDQSLFAVTPYVVGLYDDVARQTHLDAGLDLFWKPNGRFQLSATLNPDFGQVESDAIVVNFGAIETFFGDKRPFFTENQGMFEVPFGSTGSAQQLLYTRRVGAPADDGSGAGEVAYAAKVNGSLGGTNYGLFLASEKGDAGRDFFALRATRDFGPQGIGAMLTRVERPFLDRTATVLGVDHRWAPHPAWNVRTTLVGSQIEQQGRTERDSGAQMRIEHDLGGGWLHQLYLLHLGDGLQLNDFGFLERNDYNFMRYDLSRRITGLPESSPYSSHTWRWALSHRTDDGGTFLADAFTVNRRSERRDGGNALFDFTYRPPGNDVLITRGNGTLKVPDMLYGYYERFFPRKRHWSFYGSLYYSAEGLGGIDRGGWSVFAEPRYAVNDRLTFTAGLELQRDPEWLLWRHGLGTYRREQAFANLAAAWLVDGRQELRLRLEALGLDAEGKRGWDVAADGRPVRSARAVDDFALRSLGFQVRYRYEFAPLSYLYVAYVRGGSLFDVGDGPYSVRDEFARSFDLRDSEQLLVKLSYRFEL